MKCCILIFLDISYRKICHIFIVILSFTVGKIGFVFYTRQTKLEGYVGITLSVGLYVCHCNLSYVNSGSSYFTQKMVTTSGCHDFDPKSLGQVQCHLKKKYIIRVRSISFLLKKKSFWKFLLYKKIAYDLRVT